MGYVEGANASNLQCLEYLSQDKCLSSLHKGLCSNPCVQNKCLQGLAVGAIRRYPHQRIHTQGSPLCISTPRLVVELTDVLKTSWKISCA